MRGKHEMAAWRGDAGRITPADAGKTGSLDSATTVYQDHPRGCGENLSFSLPKIPVPGSPPRMRGKPEMYLAPAMSLGITPADAGKTWVFLPFI